MKHRLLVALSLLMVMGASSIGCIMHTDPAEGAERIRLSAVREALGTMPLIDAREAINITANNETIKEFLSRKFTAPNRRSVQVVLVQNSTYIITKPSADPGGSSFWGVNRSANVSESPFI